MVAALSLIVCILGILIYVLASNPKVQEMGRIAYAFGLLAFLLQGGEQVISLLGK